MVDLNKLKEKITALGDKIKSLKTSGGEKEEIDSTVKELLSSKKEYADNNNGIGVDGKPYEEPLTKAQKKAKAKAEKEAKAAAEAKASGGGGGKADGEMSKNEAKKAAKKAAAKAKKDAMKKGGGGGGDSAPAAAASDKTGKGGKDSKKGSAATTAKATTSAAPVRKMVASKISPHNLIINPNAPITDRPVIALAIACLTNTTLDYTLVSDHMSHQTTLGLPNGGVVVGDLAIAKYILKRGASGSTSTEDEAILDMWINYAQSLTMVTDEQRIKAITSTLENYLHTKTYVVGNKISIADIALFATLGWPVQEEDKCAVLGKIPKKGFNATKRWINMLSSSVPIKEATQLCIGVGSTNNKEAIFDTNATCETLVDGMNILEGATPGQVVTRFPPEPSGYLHIGHAKAALLNDYYAKRYNGRLIVRFDDTNPSKEKEEYQNAIVEDLAKLEIIPDIITYTSDYFNTIKGYAEYLINEGLAYMDDTPQEQMKDERMKKIESKHRNQNAKECMELFKAMCKGGPNTDQWCLRAKIDMSSVNGTMRDPVLYRQNLTPHHRSGTTYKAYPTYDLACPIVDSIEGVTHALRTTEYNDRDEQYQWILSALKLRKVRIHAFARMNFMYTELSKRKLTWFVDNGIVTGWDDARMPTVRGVIKRGIDISALRGFMTSQGASKRIVNMIWNNFWSENKKEIDKYSKRFMAIDKTSNTILKITNGPSPESNTFLSTDYHPKDPTLGKRIVRLNNEVLLESVDTQDITVGENIVLVRWGVINITNKSDDGKTLEGTYDPNGDIKACKKKLSWISNVPTDNIDIILTEFDNLITKEKIEDGEDFKNFINKNSIAETTIIGDSQLKLLRENDIIQLERRGYFRVEKSYRGIDKPLILYMIPDGKSKTMGGLTGKLAHH